MRIEQLVNDRNNYAANQFVIIGTTATFFQSYKTVCAKYQHGRLLLNRNYFGENFNGGSATTNKHLYIFMRDYTRFNVWGKKDVLDLIKQNAIAFTSETELNESLS